MRSFCLCLLMEYARIQFDTGSYLGFRNNSCYILGYYNIHYFAFVISLDFREKL